MTPFFYTGIGARKAPAPALIRMEHYARVLAAHGGILRTGGAYGADSAFMRGAPLGHALVYAPSTSYAAALRKRSRHGATLTAPAPHAYGIAEQHHPAWERLGNFIRALHARNAHCVLGEDLRTPSLFTLCWTVDGAETAEETSRDTGGTGLGIRISAAYGVPVINLRRDERDPERSIRRILACLSPSSQDTT